MSSNKNEKSIRNLIRLTKKELKDLRIHDLLADPKLKEAFRRAKPKHWSELTEDERKAQAKEQAEAEQEFVREQKILRVKQFFQSIMKAKCDEPNSRLFTTAEELLEFVVKYESSPSSVSNYEWNKFETILLTRLESLLQADGKEEEPTEAEQDTKREREGMIEAKPPETLAKMLWLKQHGKKHWKLISITILVILIPSLFVLPKIELFSKKPNVTANSNIFADISKDGSILRSNNFPWKISKSKDKEDNVVYIINDRYGDSSAASVFPDNPRNEYIVYNAIDGVAVKFTCPEEEISNFTIKLKY